MGVTALATAFCLCQQTRRALTLVRGQIQLDGLQVPAVSLGDVGLQTHFHLVLDGFFDRGHTVIDPTLR